MDLSFLQFDENEAFAALEQMASFAGPMAAKLLAPRSTEKPPVKSDNDDNPARSHVWKPDLRYRSLVEKLPVVTFMASLDDRLQELYVSPQIETLLGFTQEEWLDNPILWFRQLHPDDREKWVEGFAQTCAIGAHFRAEYRLFARDGRIVWVQGECQIIRDEEGHPLFLQGIAFDITHLKNAALVEEAKLAAEAASSAKSEFLARMSHEIRTPLNGVVGMIDLLRATTMTDNQQRYAQLAREAADGLLVVINDILDFSKIEAGKVEIESLEFDLHKAIEDLTELLAPMAAKKKLALVSFLRPEIPHRVIGDPNRIRQVLTNLVNNALKFTAAGSVSVRASLQSRHEGAAVIRVEVEDTGIGIPPDRLDRLFKSFSQIDSSTTRKYGGTGLGLAISKRLVELMGGEIGINSTEGKGTTFWFTLHLGTVAEEHNPSGSLPLLALTHIRLLATETDLMYRHILAEQLDGRLSPASRVVTADETLATLRHAAADGHPFHVALLPCGVSLGNDLAATIAADPLLQATRLIALTNTEDITDPADITRAGFAAQLHRPLTQSHLLEAVAAVTTVNQEFSASQIPQPRTSAKSHPSLEGLHLLVAEDNDMNQFVTEETLRRVGCTCEIFADGLQAAEAVTRSHYDAVLMDCQMPVMDGFESARSIREWEAAHPAVKRLPIIALTAEALQGDREKCLAAGMDGYVTKPIDPEQLFAAIGAFFLKKPLSPATPPVATPASQPAIISEPSSPPPIENKEPHPPIDVQALFASCLGDSHFAHHTLDQFQRRIMEDVELVRQGIAAGDVDAVALMAHSLSVEAAHALATPLGKIALEIEHAGSQRDLLLLEQQIRLLTQEAARCSTYITEARDRITHMSSAAS